MITIINSKPVTPAGLQTMLDDPEIQNITLHVANIGKIASYHVKKDRTKFQPILDNAKSQILTNFRKCYALKESKLIEKVESIFA